MIAVFCVPVHWCAIGDQSGQALEGVVSLVTGGHLSKAPAQAPPGRGSSQAPLGQMDELDGVRPRPRMHSHEVNTTA